MTMAEGHAPPRRGAHGRTTLVPAGQRLPAGFFFIRDHEARPMPTTFRPSAILVRHAAAMRAQHPSHREARVGCPDCLAGVKGRELSIRYSPARA
jgi:hypothetical protein